MKMWAGRFNGASDPEFEIWQRSFRFDKRLLPFEVSASKAHARALVAACVLSVDEAHTICDGLDQIREPEADDPLIEDVHHYVEAELVKLVGEVGYKLHTARSRNEQVATDLRLYLREHTDSTCALIIGLAAAWAEQAEAAGTHVMPSYTHLQRAEPVLVAHWMLAYAEMFLRDLDRLRDCRGRMNFCPLGSGAIAGAFVPLDRESIARELGFDGPTANSMDATSDRDFAIEFVQIAALLGVHLSRMAEELILFSTSEYGFVRLPDQFSTGSSAMPQKKNPDALELIRGKCGRLTGNAVSLLMICKGLPLAYNKDLQESQMPVFDTVEQCESLLKIALGFVETVSFNFEKMQQASTTGQMNATAAAAYLVKLGIPFRRAHEMIGASVRLALSTGCELHDLSVEQYASLGIEANEAFYGALETSSTIDSHDVVGGTAHSRVREAIAVAKERLARSSEAAHVCA